MSFNIEAVRKFYQDPILQLIRNLSNRVAKQESENIEIESDDLTGLGDWDHTLLKYSDRWNFLKKWTLPPENPQLCFEPDFDKLALDLRFDHFGNTLTDYSGFDNHAEIFGEPCPAIGVDVGYRGGDMKNTAHSVNGNDTENIYYEIQDAPKLQVLGKTIGHSIYFRGNLRSLTESNGRSQTFWEKKDDNNNEVFFRIGNDGNVKYGVLRAGTEYKTRTNTAPITPNTNVEIVLTYAVSGNVQHIYVNDSDKTLTSTSEGFEGLTNTNAVIGAASSKVEGFFDLNMIDMFRFYDEKVLTAAHVHNIFTNHITISDVNNPFLLDGCVFGTATSDSFTSTSFTNTSFTTP